MKKLYVASSWRNPYQPEVVKIAREMGFSVYDFRQPEPGVAGFSWKHIEPSPVKEWSFERYREVLAHPIAEEAFQRDMRGLQADATLLVMPAGRSAHWEHGYAVGRGQQVATLYPVDIDTTPIGGHRLRGVCNECWPIETNRAGACKLRTKLRDDFEPELMVKGGSGGILIGRAEMETWLKSVLDGKLRFTVPKDPFWGTTNGRIEKMKTPVIQEWVCDLNFMQQSVLLAAIRGPDGVIKDHPAKVLMRWYRRCILYSAFESAKQGHPFVFYRANTLGGGSFTGPMHGSNEMYPDDPEGWKRLEEAVLRYLSALDEVPHHFQLHFMHAAEIIGYKHPDFTIRDWWLGLYQRLANDMHLNPETEAQMEKRLGDNEVDWRAAEEVTAK